MGNSLAGTPSEVPSRWANAHQLYWTNRLWRACVVAPVAGVHSGMNTESQVWSPVVQVAQGIHNPYDGCHAETDQTNKG